MKKRILCLLLASDRKGEFREGVLYYCGYARKNGRCHYTKVREQATMLTEDTAIELSHSLSNKYIPRNRPKFWVERA